MFLKSIDIQGYKTFANRTIFEFAEAITVIVGPNGSGKSNIADAIRWVLGEQSYSLLRGKRTEDMIFSGSEQRPRSGMASVRILFDNLNGWLPIDYSEVGITRRAYRDGQNEYLINEQRVRLRDISELLSSSGLAERRYTVIGQGLVDSALSLKPSERRLLFEEAAGIGLYRSRRQEAERRLDKTRRNLERINDILAELQPRLKSLEKQAERARQYEQINADLQLSLREWYGFHWYHVQRGLTDAREITRKRERMLEAAYQKHENSKKKLTQHRLLIQDQQTRVSDWRKEYSQLTVERETILRGLAVSKERISSLIEQRLNVRTELDRTGIQVSLYQNKLTVSEREIVELSDMLAKVYAEVERNKQEFIVLETKRKRAASALESSLETKKNAENRMVRMKASLDEGVVHVKSRQDVSRDLKESIHKIEKENSLQEQDYSLARESHHKAVETLSSAEGEIIKHRDALREAESQQRVILGKLAKNQASYASIMTQIDLLEEDENAFRGYSSGAQILLKAAHDEGFKGFLGALSNHLRVEKKFEVAIAAALGEYLDAVLVDNEMSKERALDVLVSQTARGVIVPLRSVLSDAKVSIHGGLNEDILGVASNLVNVPQTYRPVVDLLLGRVLVVRDRVAAERALRGGSSLDRAVTMRGEVFYASGPIIAGKGVHAGTLKRPRKMREFSQKIGKIQSEISSLNRQKEKIEQQLVSLNELNKKANINLETARQHERDTNSTQNLLSLAFEQGKQKILWLEEQKERVEKDINKTELSNKTISNEIINLEARLEKIETDVIAIKNDLDNYKLDNLQEVKLKLSTDVAVNKRALLESQTRLQERQESNKAYLSSLSNLESRLIELETKIGVTEREKLHQELIGAEIGERIKSLQVLMEPVEMGLDKQTVEQASLQEAEENVRQGVSYAERENAQAQLNLTRSQEKFDSLRERIESDFGLVDFEYADDISGPTPLPLLGMVQQLPMVPKLSEGLGKNIKRQRAQLRRIGAVNPDAQTEYQEVNDRHDFLVEQIEDLIRANADINSVISELDEMMERDFRKTFEAVANEFQEIFIRLFGGGSARLLLTDPSDLANTGIDMEARLPGRRTQGLFLLSGGERSLAATALVFALLKVSPTPFCVLDEVDAMLDEANVGRFRELLRELSSKTQFIIITHNRNTVQAADVIYGVTMGRDSSSQVISMKLDEIDKVIA